MSEEESSVFSKENMDFTMPTISNEELQNQDKLISDDISKAALENSDVKIVIIPEDSGIRVPNYVIDLSSWQELTAFHIQALSNLSSINGDIPIYLYTEGKSLFRLGYGSFYKIESMLIRLKKYVFSDDIRIYKDLVSGQPVNELMGRDITKLRLSL